MTKKFNIFLLIIIAQLVIFSLMGCTIREKARANEKVYLEETESLEEVTKFVKTIRLDDLEMLIPTEEELKYNPEFEDMLWEDIVSSTEYIRMPKGYDPDFNLKKFLSIEYIYKVILKGTFELDWEDECRIVRDYLVSGEYKKGEQNE